MFFSGILSGIYNLLKDFVALSHYLYTDSSQIYFKFYVFVRKIIFVRPLLTSLLSEFFFFFFAEKTRLTMVLNSKDYHDFA